MSNIVNQLLDEGWLVTAGTERVAGSRGGPAQTLIDFNPRGVFVLGAAIGVTSRSISLVGPRGDVLTHARIYDFSARGVDQNALDWLVREGKRLIAESGIQASAILGIGIGVEFPSGIGDARIQQEAENQLVGRIRGAFEAGFGLPTAIVSGARAEAAGEVWFGGSRDVDALMYVAVGSTIDCIHVYKQELLHGTHPPRGALGHIVVRPGGLECSCGKRGCLETIAGDKAIREAGRAAIRDGRGSLLLKLCQGNPERLNADHVARAAASGEAASVEIVSDAAVALGLAIAPIVTTFTPEAIVIQGDLMAFGGDAFLTPLSQTIQAFGGLPSESRPPISKSDLFEHATEIGAAAFALDRFFFSPQLVARGSNPEETPARLPMSLLPVP
jgi:predicted NBD/HSP70 family sugar kinase